uniref:Uncharacterized protein n=1 Tax=Phaseolus vulgaris TaxID=3885 RepID=V7AHI1_PHAVU|nr:hypothetical protein PHAVU_011G116900g [Phaseolus vulgaris]ESW04690.1 hypothetical protein PHAVU_011G116900g [Phaseolus vulgaris]
MTNPIECEIPDETLNPCAAEQNSSKDPSPPQKSSPTTDSQSPQIETLTLPDPDPRFPNLNQDNDSMMRDPIPIVTVDDTEPDDPEPNVSGAAIGGGGTTTRRSIKKKKMGPKRTAKERKWREKLRVIVETLKPIPFTPAKTLDFLKYQSLLEGLGLWEFVNIEFDSPLRDDLIAKLIASYAPNNRCSYVNDFRINVNRADLGRALKLPKKAVGAAAAVVVVDDSVDFKESIAFVEELVYHWMLLPSGTCMMSSEVLGCLDLIKEGNFEKIDWAGLIWCMVEKELRAPQLVSCYYASHLQLLIKTQHKELLEEEGLEVGEEENEVKEEGEEEDEDEEGVKEEKSCVEEPFLRPCHGGDVKGLDCEQLIEDEGEDGQQEEEGEEEEEDGESDEHEGGFHLSPKCIPMEGMTSGNGLVQVMDAGHMPFGSGIDLRDDPVGDFLSSRDEPQMISGSSLFGNGHKRDNLALDNHNSHNSLNGSNKRLRSDSPWNTKPMDFETCMEQMEHWMGKARMMYATKDQACEESTMNQQLLMNELQKRDNLIEHLHKAKFEESQKRQMEVYKFEKELYMMQSLVDGYRKALKETRKAFAEYRARYPQGDEALYVDVPGSGGLVLTVMEVEKERLKKEAEERAKLRDFMIEFEKKSTDFESQWFSIFEVHLSRVESLNKRFLALEDKMKQLNEVNTNRKVSDPIECAPTTEGETA